jgi:two-component system, response regulator YesN
VIDLHKVLIVDDDRIIRRGLVTTIPWEKNGFQLVGEAGDGERALQLIREQEPQIVISDIKMPFMDGLELADQVKEGYPAIKFIFLTGYEDFNYAQRAVKIGVVDYLLKPVDRSVLLEKVKKAAKEWDDSHGEKQKINAARPFLRQVLLRKILECQETEEGLRHEAQTLNIRLQGNGFVVLLIKIDGYYENTDPATREYMKVCVGSACEEVLYAEADGGIFAMEGDELVAVYSSDEDAALVKEKSLVLAEKIRITIRDKFNKTLTLALGGIWQGLYGIHSSYAEARYVLNFRHVMGKDKVISIADIDFLVNEVRKSKIEVADDDLVDKVRLGLVDDALQCLSDIEYSLQTKRPSLPQVRLMAVDLLLALFKGAETWAKEWGTVWEEKKPIYYSKINQMPTIHDIITLLKTIVDSLGQFMVEENENSRGELIEEVTSYIEEHYAEHGLSLQDIGEYVHMNPIYLSVLFKKKKNITFTGFLLQVRMKKAKEMLRCQNMKTYEIAEKIGYSSPEYFSACFKKYAGVSPVEFKNKN